MAYLPLPADCTRSREPNADIIPLVGCYILWMSAYLHNLTGRINQSVGKIGLKTNAMDIAKFAATRRGGVPCKVAGSTVGGE